jgi:hypothetical protein
MRFILDGATMPTQAEPGWQADIRLGPITRHQKFYGHEKESHERRRENFIHTGRRDETSPIFVVKGY